MNLYKIKFFVLVDNIVEEGIKEFVLAKDDFKIYDYIDKKYNMDLWKGMEQEFLDYYDPDDSFYDDAKSPKDTIVKNKGNFDDSEIAEQRIQYEWELISENISISDINWKINKHIEII